MIMFKNWIVGLIVTCGVLSLCYAAVPKGRFRSILRCTGGLLLLFAVIQPLVQTDWSELVRNYDDWKTELDLQSEEYQKLQADALNVLIAEKTAAYIEEKATSMGVVCHAQIDCEQREGVPFPTAVTIDIPYNSGLSAFIENELDIQAESQYWQEVAA